MMNVDTVIHIHTGHNIWGKGVCVCLSAVVGGGVGRGEEEGGAETPCFIRNSYYSTVHSHTTVTGLIHSITL